MQESLEVVEEVLHGLEGVVSYSMLELYEEEPEHGMGMVGAEDRMAEVVGSIESILLHQDLKCYALFQHVEMEWA